MGFITDDLQRVLDARGAGRVDVVVEAQPDQGAAVRSLLGELGLDFDRVDVRRKAVFTATIEQPQLQRLVNSDAVLRIDHDPTFRPLGAAAPLPGEAVPAENMNRVTLGEAMQRLNVREAWEKLGHRGEGATVGVIDTPIQDSHPTLENAVAGTEANTGAGLHGTWVASAMVGEPFEVREGTIHGAAPDADLYAHGALSGGGASIGEIAEGLDYLLNQGCDVINISFGGQHSEVLHSLIQEANNEGTYIVSSAGNSGPALGSATCPAHHREATSVASVSTDDEPAAFSSRGPGFNGQSKPDVSAYGGHSVLQGGQQIVTESILGAAPINGAEYLIGTSMSSPQVAGIAALSAAAEDE